MPDSSPSPDDPTPVPSSSAGTLGARGRVALGWLAAVALALGALVVAKFAGNGDTVTQTYETLVEAEKHLDPDHIPPILPPSAHDFSVKWDEQDVVGTFEFNPSEIDLFIAAGAEEVEPHGLARELSPGLNDPEELFLKYRDDETIWTITVSEDGEGGFRTDF
jgi:hypothetical protein